MKGHKGITLIALVVTIVVLLILAGVSIAMLGGNNGIITQAQKAKDSNTTGQIKEEVELAYSSVCTDLSTGEITEDKFAEKLGEELGITVSETNKNYNFNYKGEDITISKTTGQVKTGEESIDGEIKWIYNENSDGKIEITGMDLSEYTYTDAQGNRAFYSETYYNDVTIDLTNQTLIIPDKIDGKDVVKFNLEKILLGKFIGTDGFDFKGNNLRILGVTTIKSRAKLDEFSTKSSYNYFADLRYIELPETVLKINCDFGEYGYKKIYRTVTINFANGKNSNLTIPENNWGAKRIISNGDVLYEGPDNETLT